MTSRWAGGDSARVKCVQAAPPLRWPTTRRGRVKERACRVWGCVREAFPSVGRQDGHIFRVGRNHHRKSCSEAAFIFNQQKRLHHHLLVKTCWVRTAGAVNTVGCQPGLGRGRGSRSWLRWRTISRAPGGCLRSAKTSLTLLETEVFTVAMLG